jgi:hypothetical protein
MKVVLFVSLIIPVITIILFSILIKRKKPDEYWNWWISFISTIVSLMLGVVVGVSLFEYSQNRIKLDEKARLSNMLCIELSDIYDELSHEKFTTIDNKQIQTLVIKLDEIIINEAIRSNLFDEGITNQLILISRDITMLNMSVDHYMASLRLGAINNSKPVADAFIAIMANIERYKARIKISIKKLESLLKSNLTGK